MPHPVVLQYTFSVLLAVVFSYGIVNLHLFVSILLLTDN